MKKKQTELVGAVHFVLLLALATACSQGTKPESIGPSDMCDLCRMAISDRRFAAELILKNGEVRKFDDIVCMLNFAGRNGQRQQVQAAYVTDYDTRSWIQAENAAFVRSTALATPMNGGMIAFSDPVRAGRAASAYQGKIMKWSEVWK